MCQAGLTDALIAETLHAGLNLAAAGIGRADAPKREYRPALPLPPAEHEFDATRR